MVIGRKDLTEQVVKLLKRYSAKSESAIAIAIDGEWGVGKSYMYREYLALKIEKILEKPIYTSVFGKKDENEIIQDLLIQLITREKESTEKKAKLSNWIINPIISVLSEGTIPSIDTSFIFRAFEKKDLENSIICIDDFERLSSKIPIEDVLGLISELKENKGCHIILLCNENMISENHKEKFKEYREKIIDKTFQYKPTPIEQFDLAKNLVESKKSSKESLEDDIREILEPYCAKDGVLKLNSINLREIKKVIHCFNDYCDGLEKNLFLKDGDTQILFTNIVLWFLFCYTKVRPLERELERLRSEEIKSEKEKAILGKDIPKIGGDWYKKKVLQEQINELEKKIRLISEEIVIVIEKVTHERDRLGHFKPQIPFLNLIVDNNKSLQNLHHLFTEYDKNNVFTFRNDQEKYQTYLNNEETFIFILSEIARQYRFQKEYNNEFLAKEQADDRERVLKATEKFFKKYKGNSSSVWFMLGYRPSDWNPPFFNKETAFDLFFEKEPKYKEKIQELVREALAEAENKESTNHWLNRYESEIEAFLKKKGIEPQ